MWVINIRHWLNESFTGPGLPQLKFKVQKLGEIITYATAIGVVLVPIPKELLETEPKFKTKEA
jgi:hypothetical protein